MNNTQMWEDLPEDFRDLAVEMANAQLSQGSVHEELTDLEGDRITFVWYDYNSGHMNCCGPDVGRIVMDVVEVKQELQKRKLSTN